MHGRAPEWEWKGGQAGGRHTNEVSTPRNGLVHVRNRREHVKMQTRVASFPIR